jgi:imidazolonepropionase-like amidohydrolase
MNYYFHTFTNNRILLLTVVVLVASASLLLFNFSSMTLAFTTTSSSSNTVSKQTVVQPATSSSLDYTLAENDSILLILEGATLIDGTGAPPRPNTMIVINGSKIVYVSNNNTSYNYTAYHHLAPTSTNLIDLTGKYIMPGLFDMHAHIAGVRKNSSYNQTMAEDTLNMLLAYGVTTIRNPGGPTGESVALKENVSKGKINGPQIFTAGQLLNTPQIPVPFVEKQVETEADVRQEVRSQSTAGVDYIKLYVGLTPDLVQTAIDEAHSHGMKVIGHLYLTSWTDAANFGIDALTHGVPVSPFLLAKDNQGEFFEKGDHPFNHFLWLDLADLNGPEINEMIKVLVKNKIPVDPTLDIYEAMLKDDPEDQYLWPKVLNLTKKLYDNRVALLSGSDIPNLELVPGASLHHELELLVEAGIKPLEVIKIATKNGAESLGILDKVGTIEPGKQADMMILAANPIQNISNTRKIEAVMDDGRFVDRKSLLK